MKPGKKYLIFALTAASLSLCLGVLGNSALARGGGGGHGSFGGSHGSFGGSHGSFGGSHGSFGGSHGSFGGSHGSFGGSHGSFGHSSGGFGHSSGGFGHSSGSAGHGSGSSGHGHGSNGHGSGNSGQGGPAGGGSQNGHSPIVVPGSGPMRRHAMPAHAWSPIGYEHWRHGGLCWNQGYPWWLDLVPPLYTCYGGPDCAEWPFIWPMFQIGIQLEIPDVSDIEVQQVPPARMLVIDVSKRTGGMKDVVMQAIAKARMASNIEVQYIDADTVRGEVALEARGYDLAKIRAVGPIVQLMIEGRDDVAELDGFSDPYSIERFVINEMTGL